MGSSGMTILCRERARVFLMVLGVPRLVYIAFRTIDVVL